MFDRVLNIFQGVTIFSVCKMFTIIFFSKDFLINNIVDATPEQKKWKLCPNFIIFISHLLNLLHSKKNLNLEDTYF